MFWRVRFFSAPLRFSSVLRANLNGAEKERTLQNTLLDDHLGRCRGTRGVAATLSPVALQWPLRHPLNPGNAKISERNAKSPPCLDPENTNNYRKHTTIVMITLLGHCCILFIFFTYFHDPIRGGGFAFLLQFFRISWIQGFCGLSQARRVATADPLKTALKNTSTDFLGFGLLFCTCLRIQKRESNLSERWKGVV